MNKTELMLRNLRCYNNEIQLIKLDVGAKNVEKSFNATIQCSLVGDDSKDACKKWITEFSKATHTNWIVRRTCPSPQKHAFRISYDCQHSNFHKRKGKSIYTRERNKDCKATVKIVVKKFNRHTMRNDPLLKKGLDTIITVRYLIFPINIFLFVILFAG